MQYNSKYSLRATLYDYIDFWICLPGGQYYRSGGAFPPISPLCFLGEDMSSLYSNYHLDNLAGYFSGATGLVVILPPLELQGLRVKLSSRTVSGFSRCPGLFAIRYSILSRLGKMHSAISFKSNFAACLSSLFLLRGARPSFRTAQVLPTSIKSIIMKKR